MTSNRDRAARIMPLLEAHAVAQFQPLPDDLSDACQDVLTDLMHFCEARCLDFDDILRLATLAYRKETDGPSPLPLPVPLGAAPVLWRG